MDNKKKLLLEVIKEIKVSALFLQIYQKYKKIMNFKKKYN
jgi:hypothetical protein